MGCAYFVLVDAAQPSDRLGPSSPSVMLQVAGMQRREGFGPFIVFVSNATPVLQLPGGGLILGDLYSRSGEPIQDARQLPTHLSGTALRHRVLENYWGEYVFILHTDDDPVALSVTRSPSHACGVQCIYSLRDGKGFVTSDISLAMRLDLYHRNVDFDHIAHRLVYPDMKTSRTGLTGISELLPGSTMYLRNGTVRISQDWSPWDFVAKSMQYADRHEAALAIRSAIALVVSAWADRDKSVLLELSGGLDSSIVGAGLAQSHAKVTCRTLTTPVPGADEREYGALIASMLGVELSATELQYDDAPFDFPVPQELVTPAIGPLQYAVDKIMEASAKRAGANSYFSGAGGDTVFCYLTNAAPAADAFRAAGLSTGMQAIRDLSTFHQCTYWKVGRLTWRKLAQSNCLQYSIDRSLLFPGMPLPEPELHPWLSQPTGALLGDRQRIFELSATQFFRDSCPRSLSRPVRMPLLSQPVIEACLRAPSWMWFSGGQNRAIARQAFSDVLPGKIFARRSKGTFTAYLGALYRRKTEGMLDFLLGGELQSHGLLDADALRRFAEGELPRGDSSFMRVFQLCTLENWIRRQS